MTYGIEKDIQDFKYYENLKSTKNTITKTEIVKSPYISKVIISDEAEDYYSRVQLSLKFGTPEFEKGSYVKDWNSTTDYKIPVSISSDFKLDDIVYEYCLRLPEYTVTEPFLKLAAQWASGSKELYIDIKVVNMVQNASVKTLINKALVAVFKEDLLLEQNSLSLNKYINVDVLKNYFFGYVINDKVVENPLREDSLKKDFLVTCYFDSKTKKYLDLKIESYTDKLFTLETLNKILNLIKK